MGPNVYHRFDSLSNELCVKKNYLPRLGILTFLEIMGELIRVDYQGRKPIISNHLTFIPMVRTI